MTETEEQDYDLSFAYCFRWDSHEAHIREALKVLLFNSVTEKTGPKPGERDAKKAVQEEAARIRWLLAINPNTPPPVLEHLARDQSASLLERIAENPRTHVTTLAKLSTHAHSQVRASVAENPTLSIKTIWRLAKDENPDVRHRLAESYTVPVAVLRVLCEDENPYVAFRAQCTMQRILAEVNHLRSA
ncbi:MAG: hypothetical protein JST89_00805 [Cyanobacteria bacterium SZAS-4]|nr:hypothetical protein [Cyanobacteria bacterium SZAS-4]